jgi:toxin-antitoxin system PIN domain toxin
VIAVDTNILVYAHRPEMALHTVAARAVRDLANSPRSWGVPWPCLHEFFATVTRAPFDPPSSAANALDQLAAWVESPSLVLLVEGPRHLQVLTDLVRTAALVGGKIHDARIAAICLQHGVDELITMDRDFDRFPQLRTRSLLAA